MYGLQRHVNPQLTQKGFKNCFREHLVSVPQETGLSREDTLGRETAGRRVNPCPVKNHPNDVVIFNSLITSGLKHLFTFY